MSTENGTPEGGFRTVDPRGNVDESDFPAGVPVVDRTEEPDERGTMRVLGYLVDEDGEPLTADEVEFRDGMTVASVNPEEFREDRLVEVVFEGWLDESAPGWDELAEDRVEPLDDLREWLAEYRDEWGVKTRTYHYPEGRLMLRPYCRECRKRADYLEGREVSTGAAGYYCLNPDCEDSHVLPREAAPQAEGEPDP